MALLHSVKKLGINIHLLEAGDIDPRVIIQTCEGMDPVKVCVILEVSQCTQAEREERVVYITSTLKGISLPKPVALSMILRLQSSSLSAVFYWSTRSLGYSVVLNHSPGSMWIARVSRGLSSRDVQSRLPLARSVSCPIERVVPSFYSGVDEGEMMIMGQGGSNAASWGDLEVEMSARCEPLI